MRPFSMKIAAVLFALAVITSYSIHYTKLYEAMADACLVIGSTGTVYPAASIPRAVKRAGGRVVEINPEPSEFTDEVSDVLIRLPAAEAMRRLEAAVDAI